MFTLGPRQVRLPPPLCGLLHISDNLLSVRRGVFQFVFFKPLFALLRHRDTWPITTLVLGNVSTSLAMYALLTFYLAIQYLLPGEKRIGLKLLCVKLVVFLTFWQGVIIKAFLWESHYLEALILNIECVGFAILHARAFNVREFEKRGSRLSFWRAIRDAFGFKDVVIDVENMMKGSDATWVNWTEREAGEVQLHDEPDAAYDIEFESDDEDERLFGVCKSLVYGDCNFPVLNCQDPRLLQTPSTITLHPPASENDRLINP